MSVFYEFDEVDGFTVGAQGQPGSRVFYLQVRRGTERVTIKCEKQQAAAVAQYLRRVLSDLPPAEDRPMGTTFDFATPAEPVFVLGPIGLGYDRSNDRILIQLEEISEVDLVDDEDGDDESVVEDVDRGHVRCYLERGQAAAFCDHADKVISAGRPDCQWCGLPIDPAGHPCPRMN